MSIMQTPLRHLFPCFLRDPVFTKIRGNGALRRPGRRPSSARQARLCRTYGRRLPARRRAAAREKQRADRTPAPQVEHLRRARPIRMLVLARRSVLLPRAVRVQGPPAQPKGTKNSGGSDPPEFAAPPGAPAGLEPGHRGVFRNTHLRGLEGDISGAHDVLCNRSAHTPQRHGHFAH